MAKYASAIIALIPSEADSARLAVDGGLSAADLHMTLATLGDAAQYGSGARARLEQALKASCAGKPFMVTNGFNISVFNPGSDSACVVVGCSRDMIYLRGWLRHIAGITLGDIFTDDDDFIPHVTLKYIGNENVNIADYEDRIGAITFDRVGLYFGDDRRVLPLGWLDSKGLATQLSYKAVRYVRAPVVSRTMASEIARRTDLTVASQ